MNKWNGLVLSALILCAALLPAQAADSPLVLGLLEIRGLDSLAASAFELSKAAGSPTPKEMISMVLYGALGTMPGMGLPAEGTVRAVAFDNGSDNGGWAILLPVANEGADYLAGLGQNGWKNESETADGLLHYVAPDGAGVAWKEVYFLKRGATLLAAQTADDARMADAAQPLLPPSCRWKATWPSRSAPPRWSRRLPRKSRSRWTRPSRIPICPPVPRPWAIST